MDKSPEVHEVVVIGAGPGGLAIARQLQHEHHREVLIVERASAPVPTWRARYDNFRLNTSGFWSHLPGQRIPLRAGRWPSRDAIVRYFDDYVQRQHLRLRLECEVERVDRVGEEWQLQTSGGVIRARAVVLACGNYRTPNLPEWPGFDGFTGEFVHSMDFRNAWPYRDRSTLVVGAANSAADIAVQLVNAGASRVLLSVRTPPHLVRRAFGPFPLDLLLVALGRKPASVVDPLIDRWTRATVGDLSAYGFKHPEMGLKATVEQRGRIPTFADELIAEVRAGKIEVVSAVEGFDGKHVLLADGTSMDPDVVVAATGFSSDLSGLVGHLGVLNARGKPGSGYATDCGDGLYSIGYGEPFTGPLRQFRKSAPELAKRISQHLNITPRRNHVAVLPQEITHAGNH